MESNKRRRSGRILHEHEEDDKGTERKRSRPSSPSETEEEEVRAPRDIGRARSGIPHFTWEILSGEDVQEVNDIRRAIATDYADYITAYQAKLRDEILNLRSTRYQEEIEFSEESIGSSSDEESEGDDSDFIPSDIE